MLHTGCHRAFTFAVTLTTLSSRITHFATSNAAAQFTGIPGGHPIVRAACTVGRMDCLSIYYPDRCKWRSDVRHAENTSQQESQKEEDSREC